MRKAGAGKAFKYASSHSVYTSAAKANRLAGNANPFKAYRLAEVAPRVGDLICGARAGRQQGDLRHDPSGDEDPLRHRGRASGRRHADRHRRQCRTIRVTTRTVHTDDLGRVIEPNAFAVIRVGLHKPRVPGTPSAGLTPPGPRPARPAAPTIGPSPTPPAFARTKTLPVGGTGAETAEAGNEPARRHALRGDRPRHRRPFQGARGADDQHLSAQRLHARDRASISFSISTATRPRWSAT